MTDAYARKYHATAFDSSDPNEAVAERARVAVLTAYRAVIGEDDNNAPRQAEYIVAGLHVGLVQVIQACLKNTSDENDAAILASIVQTAGWAVDTARAMQGKDPLGRA